MPPFPDYYAILEIQFGASADEIKKAWMQLVKRWQSKANSGDSVATERLQEINAAYEVLSGPQKLEYDIQHIDIKEPFIDFYAILEIPTNALPSDIRQSHRKQEFWWRPDRNLNDPDAPLRYHLIQLAYKTLGDPDARSKYDRDYFWKKHESQQREQQERLKRESERLQQEIERQKLEADEKRRQDERKRQHEEQERLKRKADEKQRREAEQKRQREEQERLKRERERQAADEKRRRERRKRQRERAEKERQQREKAEQQHHQNRQNQSYINSASRSFGVVYIALALPIAGIVLWGAWTLSAQAWQSIFSTDPEPVVVTRQPTATYTPIPTATYTPQPPSPVPTDTPMPAVAPASTPLPTDTATPIPTDTPVPTATSSPTYTATPMPTDTPTLTPSPTYTFTPSPVPTDTPAPAPPPTDTPIPTPTLTPTPEPTDAAVHSYLTISTPECNEAGIDSAYLRNLKVGVRQLINDVRVAEGVPPLLLAGSGVSQCHAEDMANNCFVSHWSTDGTKPHVRYASAGYKNRVVEIVDGHNYCTQDVSTTDIATRIRDIANRLLDDPEHRQKLVDVSNVSLDIGIAADEHRNLWLVIGLASDFIEFEVPPRIDNFEISVQGRIENGARISSTEGLRIEIYYDPLPEPLTRGQLARTTSCVELGEMEARLLRPGPNYVQRSFLVDKPACLNPYQSPPHIEPPGSIQGADELSDHMDIQAAAITQRRHAGLLIVASEWEVSESQDFSVKADLEEVVKRHGNGIYTTAIYALLDDETQIVAEHPMFVTDIK